MPISPSERTATRYVLYARKSNDREDRQIRSLPDQAKLAHEEAARDNVTVVREILESKSAKRPGQRDGFAEMVRMVEDGEADGILCWHPDRLARNAVDGGWVLDLLDRGKLKDLRFLSYTFDNSPEGKFALGMVFSQAKYYVDKLSGDVTRGMRQVRQEGGFPHYVPEGYKNVRLDNGRKDIVPDPDRFPLLRRAVDLMLSEIYPPAEALRQLNSWGYRTRTTAARPGGPISECSWYRMLHNPFYAGRCRDGEIWYQGRHQPLMTEAEFSKIQKLVGRKDTPSYRKHNYAYAGGLFTCGNCGCQITATLANGKYKKGSWIYYHCTNRRGNCTKRGTREEVVEEAVTALLRRVAFPCEIDEPLLTLTYDALRDEGDLKQEAGMAASRRLTEAKAEREKLLPLLLKGVLSDVDYRSGVNRLDAEIRSLEDEQVRMLGKFASNEECARNVITFAATAQNTFQAGSPEVKRRVVKMLACRRVLTPGQPLLEPHPYVKPFVDLAPQLQAFKPKKISYPNPKESLLVGKLSFGGPNTYRTELCELPDSLMDTVKELANRLARAIRASGEPYTLI
jgi:site-specific DNA recombinase